MLSNPTVNLSVSKAEFCIVKKIKEIVITFSYPLINVLYSFYPFSIPLRLIFHPQNLTPIMEQSCELIYEGNPRFWLAFFVRAVASWNANQHFYYAEALEQKTFKISGIS